MPLALASVALIGCLNPSLYYLTRSLSYFKPVFMVIFAAIHLNLFIILQQIKWVMIFQMIFLYFDDFDVDYDFLNLSFEFQIS
jgi:hypothetical protein